ncbi:MAG: hypothetical protein KGL39_18590 [Patescibacteria group bacterium]|nr:hypothetical protein [Patescibacteria group bacterium]
MLQKSNDDPPAPLMLPFHTRHFRQDLHARLHALKARRNGRRQAGEALTQFHVVFNEAVEAGLAVLESDEKWRGTL